MKFNSAQEIFDEIDSGLDLYFTESEIYVFTYAERGSIAYYYIDMDELLRLANEVDGYIGEALGPGGYVLDPDIKLADGKIVEYGTPEFNKLDGTSGPGWEYDYTPILDFLERFVGEDCISAMPSDLLEGGNL